MDEQLRSTLGDQRMAEYQRAQDSNYRNLLRVAERYSLPQETVFQAYELEKAFRTQPQPVPDPADPQNTAQTERLRQLSQQLTTVLGDKAAKAYRRVRGGLMAVDPGP